MKRFAELNIKMPADKFIGKQIKISQVFNKDIEIHRYKIEPSKKNESILLTLQIKFENEHRVIFCGSKNLSSILELIPQEEFPFACQIINESTGYNLT